jgi:hypothetical protein
MTPQEYVALSFGWKVFLYAAAIGGLLWGLYKASKEGAKKGNQVVVEKTDEQTKLLHTIAADQLEMRREIKASNDGLAQQVGELRGQQGALSDGQRAIQDTVLGLALAHVQLEAIVQKRDPDNERLKALTAKITPNPPAPSRGDR